MKIIKNGRAGTPSVLRDGTFTGSVWGDSVLPEQDDVLINNVTFEPGGRTYWHTHRGGQILIVTVGSGRCFDRDGEGGAIAAGDVVFIPPGVEHWHGAAPDSLMTHMAITLRGHDWLEEVTDDVYGS
jgi:quercetin dioxygenase-like cupin family protein